MFCFVLCPSHIWDVGDQFERIITISHEIVFSIVYLIPVKLQFNMCTLEISLSSCRKNVL